MLQDPTIVLDEQSFADRDKKQMACKPSFYARAHAPQGCLTSAMGRKRLIVTDRNRPEAVYGPSIICIHLIHKRRLDQAHYHPHLFAAAEQPNKK